MLLLIEICKLRICSWWCWYCHLHVHLLHRPITQCNYHPFIFYLPFNTSPPVDQCPIYAPSNCTMGLDTYAYHPPFGRTDLYYTVIFYSSCGLNKRPVATLAFSLSVSVLSSQYLFKRGPIWMKCLATFYNTHWKHQRSKDYS